MNRNLFSKVSIAAITVRRTHHNFYLIPNWPECPFLGMQANSNIKEVCCTYRYFNCSLQKLVEAIILTMIGIIIIYL